jgi:hypothetical protein
MSKSTLPGMKAGRPSAARPAPKLADVAGKSVRVNFEIDSELHRKLKMLAIEQGRSVSDILRDSIAKLVA